MTHWASGTLFHHRHYCHHGKHGRVSFGQEAQGGLIRFSSKSQGTRATGTTGLAWVLGLSCVGLGSSGGFALDRYGGGGVFACLLLDGASVRKETRRRGQGYRARVTALTVSCWNTDSVCDTAVPPAARSFRLLWTMEKYNRQGVSGLTVRRGWFLHRSNRHWLVGPAGQRASGGFRRPGV